MHQPNINCYFFSNHGKCGHLDMPRGLFGFGGNCILRDGGFASKCKNQIEQKRLDPPPPPPPADE